MRAGAAIAKGSLKLVAATQRIEKVGSKANAQAVRIGDVGKVGAMQLVPHFVPPCNAQGVKNKAPWVVAFWAVQESDSPNMKLTYARVEVGNFTVCVPTLVNTKERTLGETRLSDRSACTCMRDSTLPCMKKPMFTLAHSCTWNGLCLFDLNEGRVTCMEP